MCLKGRGLSQDGTKRGQRLPTGIFIMQKGNVGGGHITCISVDFHAEISEYMIEDPGIHISLWNVNC